MILLICFFLASVTASWAGAGGESIRISVDGKDWAVLPPPIMVENRVFVPLRAIAAVLGADVAWNAASRTVNVRTPAKQGELYLQGLGNRGAEQPGIEKNFISATALRDLLDDDRDGDLADYRKGHSGGDTIANDL
ncbi:MAG: copper amine oxidase N-terminal domain-containing protein [Bacillota bacterium]